MRRSEEKPEVSDLERAESMTKRAPKCLSTGSIFLITKRSEG